MKNILSVVVTMMLMASAAMAQNTKIYKEQGGAKEVVLSGGEIEVRTGGLIDMQAGSTLTINQAAQLNISAQPTFTDITVTYGIGTATGVFSGAVSAATINTGQGDAEAYLQNQNLRTTDDITFKNVAATYGVTAASGTFTGSTVLVSTAATSSESICLVGAVAALPASGYGKNCLAVLTSDNALYISTEAAAGTWSWVKVGAQ